MKSSTQGTVNFPQVITTEDGSDSSLFEIYLENDEEDPFTPMATSGSKEKTQHTVIHTSTSLRLLSVLVILLIAAITAGILTLVRSPSCPPADCTDVVAVMYGTSVEGPYDLTLYIGDDTVMTTARCNDPSAYETRTNPHWVQCTSEGFTLWDIPPTGRDHDHDLGTNPLIKVSIALASSHAAKLLRTEVLNLTKVGEYHVNEPDCGQTCTEHVGELPVATFI